MKVLHVINNLGSGGAESMLLNFFKELNGDNYFEILLLVDAKMAYDIPNNINVKILSKSNKRYSLKKLIALYKYIKKNKFSIVHSHLFPSQYYVFFVKLILGSKIKIVTTEHNTTNKRRNYWLLKQIDRIIYYSYDNVIFISNGVKNQFIKDFGYKKFKTIVLPNGIPLDKFYPKVTKTNSKKINIIMVARFDNQKDHNTLLKAMSYLDNDFILNLAGIGPNKENIQKLAHHLGLENKINFLGFRNDIANLYREHDIFVLASNWEGFGLVAVEAMASGIPVIASDVDGLNEVIGNAGLLFKPKDAKELAKQIKNISKDENLRKNLIKNGIKRAKEYDIKTLVSSTLTMYKIL